MSVQALAGLAGLNVLYATAGGAFLWLVRGASTWTEVGRLAGLAYLLGVVLTGGLWTLALVVGVPFSLATVLVVPLGLTVMFAVAARRRGRRTPSGAPLPTGWQLYVTACGIAAVGVLLEGLFRVARLSGLYWFDGWAFWVPKGKVIYFFGELDERFFTELPGASYPPLVPVLDAAAFHVLGAPDVVTLHAQFWLLGVGFVWALAGLLAERVPPWILWPFVLLPLVAPRVGRRFQITEADLALDYLFVVAAVLVALWAMDRERWRLVAATVLLSGMVLTKREGLLLATLLVVAALVATVRRGRSSWPALGVVALVTAAVAIPWRIWYVVHDVEGETGTDGLVEGDILGIAPAARRAFEVFWDPGYWNLIVPLFVVALVVAALARAGAVLVFLGTLVALVFAGGVWATWVFSQAGPGFVLGGNFVIRYMGAAALLCVAATPLLLSAAWPTAERQPARPPGRRAIGLATAVVTVPLLIYPAVTIATGGAPRFPTRDECARPATSDAADLEVVYGRFDDPLRAAETLAALTEIGFIGAETEPDPCGRWKVSYDAIDSLAQGEALATQVREAGFEARVEHEG